MFDLIIEEILRELPRKSCLKFTNLINAAFKLKHILRVWKIAAVTMIPEPKKKNFVTQAKLSLDTYFKTLRETIIEKKIF